MTKLFPLTSLCILLVSTVLCAQSPVGSFSISTGIGIIPTYTGKTASTNIPALSLQVDYRVSEKFSLGAYAGFTEATSTPREFSDGTVSQVNNKTSMFGLKGQFHRDFSDKIQLYGGFLIGLSRFNTTETDINTGEVVKRQPDQPTPYNPNAPKGQFLYSGFVGSKYSINPKLGFFTELGFGISLVNLGFKIQL